MFELLMSKLRKREEWVDCNVVFFINPYTYTMLRKNKQLVAVADCIYLDGWFIPFVLKMLFLGSYERISFDNTSLAPEVFSYCVEHNLKISIVGSDEMSNNVFLKYLKDKYSGISIGYSRDGYFKDEEEKIQCVRSIVNDEVDVVVCGMGAGNQEAFIELLISEGYAGRAFTCGGFIHQTANSGGDYYPLWVDKLGLRFLYRMYDEPKLIRRYLIDYSRFVIFFMFDSLFKK